MTAPRGLDSPTGLLPGDHVCWSFDGAADLARAVVASLDEGRRRGEQLLLAGASGPALAAALEELPHREELLASGQLALQTGDASPAAAGLSPLGQVAHYRAEVQAALDGGRTGLRVVADVSALLRAGPAGRRRLHAYEGLVDAVTGTVPMTAVCLYDGAVGADVLGPVAVLHPVQHLGDRHPLAHLSGRGRRLALHGEVDTSEAASVRTALVDLAGDDLAGDDPAGDGAAAGEVVLDVSDLDFIDVAGGRALHGAARDLSCRGIGLRLTGARRHVRRCLDLFDLVPEPA